MNNNNSRNLPTRFSRAVNFFVSYLFYPLLLSATVAQFFIAKEHGWNLATVFAWMAGARMLLLLGVEFLHPANKEWAMTWASFRRDVKYMLVNGGIAGVFKFGIGILALNLSVFNTGIVANTSIWVEFVAVLLVFEFFQYWYHRLSHEDTGRWGALMWKIHVAHHLPDRIYLLMHPVGHPINLLLSLSLVQLLLVILGARPEAIFLFNALMGLQGLVSHLNIDMKAGPLNYLLVGTELHRNHHSADIDEAKNYGVLTPFWDIVFGTFVYKKNRMPKRIGVVTPAEYPASTDIFKVLAIPFK